MRRRTKLQNPAATINLTSLLDVTFVLLIAFMVVAPALRFNVDLELPKVGEGERSEESKPVTLQVKAGGDGGDPVIHVNGTAVAFAGMVTQIKSTEGFTEETAVSFEADRRVEWDQVARIINTLKANGIEKLGIITEYVP